MIAPTWRLNWSIVANSTRNEYVARLQKTPSLSLVLAVSMQCVAKVITPLGSDTAGEG